MLVAAGCGPQGQVASSYLCFSMMPDLPADPLAGLAVRGGLPIPSIYRKVGAEPWLDWLYLLTGRGTTVCPRL
ncbi:hypothetical protein EMIT0194MI4_50131 [Pseudomonas sp. IT-194MI4]